MQKMTEGKTEERKEAGSRSDTTDQTSQSGRQSCRENQPVRWTVQKSEYLNRLTSRKHPFRSSRRSGTQSDDANPNHCQRIVKVEVEGQPGRHSYTRSRQPRSNSTIRPDEDKVVELLTIDHFLSGAASSAAAPSEPVFRSVIPGLLQGSSYQ